MTNESSLNNIVVYGLSTEGYGIASSIALRGKNVSIIDDSAGMSISLKTEIAKAYPDVGSLMEDEPLLTVEPIDIATKKASYVFFCPRIRKTGSDVKNYVTLKFQDAIKNISKEGSIIYTVPTGIGGNNENIALIEHLTGLTVGKDINYYYYPSTLVPSSISENYIGSFGSKNDLYLTDLLNISDLGKPINFVDLGTAEFLHIIKVLSHYSSLASIFEICRQIKESKNVKEMERDAFNNFYLDDVSNGLYDLRAIGSSLGGASPLMYLVNGSTKAIESYLKNLTDEIKILLKKRDLKASKTRVRIAWTLDQNEMRGDKLNLLDSLEMKLRDYISDVDRISTSDLYSSEKTTITIVCSKSDMSKISNKGMNIDIIIKASPIAQIIN